MRLSVWDSREIQATILAIRVLPRELQAQIRKQTKAVVLPEWKQAVAERATTLQQHRVLVQNARATVSNQNVTLTAAAVGRPLSGGFAPKRNYPAIEFGASPKVSTVHATSKRGKRYTMRRDVHAQLPRPRRGGYVVFPAARDIIPRIASLWVQTTVRTVHEAFERK